MTTTYTKTFEKLHTAANVAQAGRTARRIDLTPPDRIGQGPGTAVIVTFAVRSPPAGPRNMPLIGGTSE